jgi:hypothetical protein
MSLLQPIKWEIRSHRTGNRILLFHFLELSLSYFTVDFFFFFYNLYLKDNHLLQKSGLKLIDRFNHLI